ncbi:F-box protein SKIP19-like [Setaria italica]|uniref:F-box protein SKIP19-like n=1 Tax=Setaria italica TaxID=4555 RepID=UPI000350EC86|nr:F-box protein SKIP19-like [Setaria italica]
MPSRGIGGRGRSRRARRRREEAAAEPRDWADGLGPDLLLEILGRLDHADILMSADRVCWAWRRAAREEPTLWRRVVMRGGGGGLDGISRRLNRCGAACEAVRRGAGLCEAVCVEYAADDGFLIYLSEMAPKLKSLRLICCNDVTEEGFTGAVQELPLLEELELSLCDNVGCSVDCYELVADKCIQLKHFRLSRHDSKVGEAWWQNKDVPAIASMHRLRSLQLFGNTLSSNGLETILDNCPQLESLDIRRCANVKMDGTLLAKCSKIKKIRLPGDSIDDYDLKDRSKVRSPVMRRGNHRVVQPFRGNYHHYFNRDEFFPRLSR